MHSPKDKAGLQKLPDGVLTMSVGEEERCTMERVRTPGDRSVSLCALSLAEFDGCSGVEVSSAGATGAGTATGVGAGASRVSSVVSIVGCWSYFLHFALHHDMRCCCSHKLSP